MAKKSFDIAAAASSVYGSLIGSAQVVHNTQEVQQVQAVQEEQTAQQVHEVPQLQYEEPRTQGRKGMKQQRINMAFTDANLDYLRTMAALQGKSITQYVNALIAADREKNAAAYEAAKQIVQNL